MWQKIFFVGSCFVIFCGVSYGNPWQQDNDLSCNGYNILVMPLPENVKPDIRKYTPLPEVEYKIKKFNPCKTANPTQAIEIHAGPIYRKFMNAPSLFVPNNEIGGRPRRKLYPSLMPLDKPKAKK